MTRTFFTLAVGAVIGIGGLTLAGDHQHGKVTVKTVSEKDIAEKVDEMKVSLLKARRFIIEISGIEVEDEDLEESALTDEQVEYLLAVNGRSVASQMR